MLERKGRRSYRALNFCERPKITGRRVPDVVEICNFENRSPRGVYTALPVVPLCFELPLGGGWHTGDTFVTREGYTRRSCFPINNYCVLSFVACTSSRGEPCRRKKYRTGSQKCEIKYRKSKTKLNKK